MNPAYPANFPIPVDDPNQQPPNVYNPQYPYDYYGAPLNYDGSDPRMDPDAYSSDYDSDDDDSFSTDSNYPPGHHGHDFHGLPKLQIRRHIPGSNDPALQNLPANLESSENRPTITDVKVTVKRHPKEPERNVIQPILYPVPVYMNPQAPQNINNQPFPLVSPYQPIPIQQPVQFIQPPPPVQPMQFVQSPPPLQPVQLVQPVRQTEKPPSPVKKSPIPPAISDRPETESFPLPTPHSRQSNLPVRKPVRTDMITPAPSTRVSQRPRPDNASIGRNNAYGPSRQGPSTLGGKKIVSYRTAPGKSTRELENDQLDEGGEPVLIKSPPTRVVTYRKP